MSFTLRCQVGQNGLDWPLHIHWSFQFGFSVFQIEHNGLCQAVAELKVARVYMNEFAIPSELLVASLITTFPLSEPWFGMAALCE